MTVLTEDVSPAPEAFSIPSFLVPDGEAGPIHDAAASDPPAGTLTGTPDREDEADAATAAHGGLDTPPPLSAEHIAEPVASVGGYSVADLFLFRRLTGYRLDTKSPIWRAVDETGQRTPIADRLFTTLAEEAFRLADRQRRSSVKADLTIDDLALVLLPMKRAAAAIGTRGLDAFARLEAAVERHRNAEITAIAVPDLEPLAG